MISIFKKLNKNIEDLNTNFEETRQIQLEQKKILEDFITILTSFFAFEKKMEIKREKEEEKKYAERTPAEHDMRF